MIRDFEPVHRLEPAGQDRFQWIPALGAGLIAGLVLLLVPRGTPWSALTFFAPIVMGRVVPDHVDMGFLSTSLIHLLVGIIYGLIISLLVTRVTQMRAVLLGGVAGLGLYLINFGVVSLWFPSLRGSEPSVIFTHVVFGLVAAGAYRGLLRRQPAIASPPT